MKAAKIKVAKHWCFAEGRQDRFLQILRNIGFLLKAAKMRGYAVRAAESGAGEQWSDAAAADAAAKTESGEERLSD